MAVILNRKRLLPVFVVLFFITGNVFCNFNFGDSQTGSKTYVINLSESKNAALININGYIQLDDETILIRTSQIQFIAVQNICTYSKCTLEIQGNKLICPCHGCEYEFNGKVTQGPAKNNLTTYKTTYDPDKGTVTVTIP